ncbi:thiol peroxidase [Enterococcus sp. UD-01]|jgi:thiol peroxidase|uniref:thiol peroxidase n=1 Tax=Enterococcus sp. UD-01 TaxID=3373911 RepID=UPI0038340CB8
MKVTKKGQVYEIIGTQPQVGQAAPAFSLENLADEVVKLADFAGQPVLISVVPDIDTRVCSLQTKRFNQEAASVTGVKFITISNNTKEEQANWCAAEGVDMEILHDTKGTFGEAYGLFIPELEQLARAILIVDQAGTLVYQAISPEIAEEPDYEAALNEVKAIS